MRSSPWIVLLLLALFSTCCSGLSPTPQPPHKFAVYKITKIVDKYSGQPINNAHLYITIERPEQKPLEFEDKSVQTFRVEIPVGAFARILVEAPGYKDWEIEVRFNSPKYLEGPVEMEPLGKLDG